MPASKPLKAALWIFLFWALWAVNEVPAKVAFAGKTASFGEGPELEVSSPPASLVQSLKLAPFYTKHVSAGGLPVVGSKRVSDYALMEAAYLIDRMLDGCEDLRQALIQNKIRFVVMACDEYTSEIPEHSDLKPSKFWDRRARGLGATPHRPAVSCGEENLLGYPGDPYQQENILIHEFAHTIHHMGLNSVDEKFDARLEALYQEAMKKGLWEGKYAADNRAEYWAEGVQSWFDTNRENDHDHNHVNTREELKEYDPGLARLIEKVFKDNPWRYRRPSERGPSPHLKGYDPSKAPRFAWPPGLLEWYRKYEEEQKAEKTKKHR